MPVAPSDPGEPDDGPALMAQRLIGSAVSRAMGWRGRCAPENVNILERKHPPHVEPHARGYDARAGEGGFVLIVVLWILALVALSASMLAAATTGFVEIVRNDQQRVRATLLADAGIRLAMQDLLRPPAAGRGPRFEIGAAAVSCRMPDGEVVTIRIDDEAGKVDLNVASDELMRAVFTGLGVAEDRAGTLVDAIADFRDSDDERRPNGAEAKEYAEAGRPAGPKNAVFDSVVELGGVLGVTPELFAQLRPLVTVHSAQSGVDPRFAPPELAAILARAEPIEITGTASTIPSRFAAASIGRAFTIEAEIAVDATRRVARRAIVTRTDTADVRPRPGDAPLAENMSRPRRSEGRPPPALTQGLRVHQWDHVSPRLQPDMPGPGLPQC